MPAIFPQLLQFLLLLHLLLLLWLLLHLLLLLLLLLINQGNKCNQLNCEKATKTTTTEKKEQGSLRQENYTERIRSRQRKMRGESRIGGQGGDGEGRAWQISVTVLAFKPHSR